MTREVSNDPPDHAAPATASTADPAPTVPASHAPAHRAPVLLPKLLDALRAQDEGLPLLLHGFGPVGLARLALVSRPLFRAVQPLLPQSSNTPLLQTAQPATPGTVQMLNSDAPLRDELGCDDEDRRVAAQQFLAEWCTRLQATQGPFAVGRAVQVLTPLPRYGVGLDAERQLVLGSGLVELWLSAEPILQTIASRMVGLFAGTPYAASQRLSREALVRVDPATRGPDRHMPMHFHPACANWPLLREAELRGRKVEHMLQQLELACRGFAHEEPLEQAMARFLKAHPRSQEPVFERALVAFMTHEVGGLSARLRSDEFARRLVEPDPPLHPGGPGLPPQTVQRARARAEAAIAARQAPGTPV